MHVLFCLPNFEGLGVQRLVAALTYAWDRERAPLTLCVHARTGALRDQFAADVPVLLLSELAPDLPKLRVLLRPLAHRRAIDRARPDVVVSFVPGDNLSLLSLRRLGLGADFKLVVSENIHVTSQVPDYPPAFRAAYTALLPRWYPLADAVLCVAEESREDLIAAWGVPRGKTVVIPNPVDLERVRANVGAPIAHRWFATPREVPVLVAAGRLEAQKRFDRLLEAVALVQARTPVRLALLGEGPLRPLLEAQAARLGIAGQVWFAGFQQNPWSYMAQGDLFVLSSDYEGFPLVVVEAMAAGVPVVSTACPSGPREMLQGGALGFLVEQLTAPALAEAILRALGDRAEARRRAELARAAAAAYSAEAVAASYLALCELLMRGRGAAG